ncbi:MAG: xylulokinase [Clostridia bacterium]|nr:xylulokinase [Clostridia bacterium]
MKYVLGIDLGTSGTKTVLFDQTGKAMASNTVEYPMYQPRNGWAEQDPADWYHAAVETIRNVLSGSGVDPKDVVSLGISGQMHGLVMLDGKGEVIRRSIIWCDQRTAAECDEIHATVGKARLIEITANPALTGFTLSKLLWVRNHEPENYARCEHILLPKDYVRYMLTGDFATEVSDASGMQMLDVPGRCWSEELLKTLNIDPGLLAKVYESPEVTGHISAEAAKLTGLTESTLVVGGAGDNAAAAVGTGVVEDGRAFTTIGTSGVVFAHTDQLAIDPQGRVHTFCCAVPGAWHVMGVTQAAGLSLKWFRDTFCEAERDAAAQIGCDPYDLMNQEAARSPIGSNKLLYAPYLMGERTPHLDADCRGMFVGLSAMHKRRDLLRAVMEGVTFSLRDCLGVLDEMGVKPAQMLACGGGGRSPLWRQMLADVFDLPVATTVNTEGPALGVAILAGVGAGLYSSVPEACRAMIHVNEPQLPIAANVAPYAKVYAVYQQLYRANREVFKALAALE